MKKKYLRILPISLILFILVVTQISALEIKMDNAGNIYFYQDEILGEDSSNDNKQEVPVKTIRSYEKRRIEIRPDENQVRIKVRRIGDDQNLTLVEDGFSSIEEIETDRVRMKFPYGASKIQEDARQKRQEFKDEQLEKRGEIKERRNELGEELKVTRENYREEWQANREELKEKHKEYLEQLKEQRRARFEEVVEVRSRVDGDGDTELELVSRSVRARLHRAEFIILDSETGEVLLTTPSGNEHILQHLPDQALKRMRDYRALGNDSSISVNEVELETTEDGLVLYKTKATKIGKLLGLFNREIETEVVLDDATGEVIENELRAVTLLGRILNSLSF